MAYTTDVDPFEDDDTEIFPEGKTITLIVDEGPKRPRFYIETKVMFSRTELAYLTLATTDDENMLKLMNYRHGPNKVKRTNESYTYEVKDLGIRVVTLQWRDRELVMRYWDKDESEARNCEPTPKHMAEVRKRWPPISAASDRINTVTLVRQPLTRGTKQATNTTPRNK